MLKINELTSDEVSGIRFVLSDIDDTMTTKAKLLPEAYVAIWRLKEAGFIVIPVTGRAAGRCDIISREWPVDAVIAESGGVVFWEEKPGDIPGSNLKKPLLHRDPHPTSVPNTDPLFSRIRERVLKEVPGSKPAKDSYSRLYDISFDYAEEEPVLSHDEAEHIARIAREEGAEASISNIHVNIWKGKHDKLTTAAWFLEKRYDWKPGPEGDRELFYIGDAPNDEALFERFPLTAGVANVRKYEGMMKHYPRFVASKDCGTGFAEIVDTLISRK
jgi:hydroxymethylpyrimidine pyrophosphatase-like HAD family hydrolase